MKLCFTTLLLCLTFIATSAISQEASFEQKNTVEQVTEDLKNDAKREDKLSELVEIIKEERKTLATLNKKQLSNEDDLELERNIEQQKQDLEVVQKSFEQVAIGGINLDVFNQEDIPQSWQEELTLIIKPLLENLRNLTEKPRRLESLRQTISLEKSASETASLALQSIDELLSENESNADVIKELESVKSKWDRLLTESQRKQELATIELSNLEGDEGDWLTSANEALKNFAQDRGLTLLIAALVAISILFFFKFITRVIEFLRQSRRGEKNRITFRVIAYAQKFMAIIFAIFGILIVFFIRGDILLLALMGVLFFAGALGLRQFLPQFLEESRILLDIGRVRENELVIFNGIPWRVASINIFTKLINPELKGVLRLPLGDVKELVSRKMGEESWFPSSIGDWILDNENILYEVVSQSPDAVELHSSQGKHKMLPSNEYYASGFVNLTKSNNIRITSIFGVDYSLQAISLDKVPNKLKQSIQNYLESKNLGTKEINTRVDLQSASSSSIDYLIIVNVGTVAAKHYYAIHRYIQQACIQACNEEGWTIPFPQLTIHQQNT